MIEKNGMKRDFKKLWKLCFQHEEDNETHLLNKWANYEKNNGRKEIDEEKRFLREIYDITGDDTKNNTKNHSIKKNDNKSSKVKEWRPYPENPPKKKKLNFRLRDTKSTTNYSSRGQSFERAPYTPNLGSNES